MAQWGFHRDAWEIEEQASAPNPFPTEGNTELRRTFGSEMEALVKRGTPAKINHYHLMHMLTHPDFQKRGAGAMLMNWGLEKADRDGVPVVLTATALGVFLYRKFGFVEVDRMEIPLEPYGGQGTHVHVAMIRQPQPWKSNQTRQS